MCLSCIFSSIFLFELFEDFGTTQLKEVEYKRLSLFLLILVKDGLFFFTTYTNLGKKNPAMLLH